MARTAISQRFRPEAGSGFPEAWLALDAASDVFGASNVGKPVLVNGGVLVLRNTAWARELVRAWWRNRCGPADQYALWKSLAELWRRDHPKFSLSDGVFANYASARERFLPEVARKITDGALPARGCAADATCAALFRASAASRPLALPHLYVTPVAGPFRAADGSAVRPLQKGDHAWMCHFDRVHETPNHDLRPSALEAAVGARDAARVPRSWPALWERTGATASTRPARARATRSGTRSTASTASSPTGGARARSLSTSRCNPSTPTRPRIT